MADSSMRAQTRETCRSKTTRGAEGFAFERQAKALHAQQKTTGDFMGQRGEHEKSSHAQKTRRTAVIRLSIHHKRNAAVLGSGKRKTPNDKRQSPGPTNNNDAERESDKTKEGKRKETNKAFWRTTNKNHRAVDANKRNIALHLNA